MLRLEVAPVSEGFRVSGVLGETFRTLEPTGRSRFDSTKPTELHFSALLTESDARVRFYREGFDRLKEDLV
jgi:hypothetical protein